MMGVLGWVIDVLGTLTLIGILLAIGMVLWLWNSDLDPYDYYNEDDHSW